MFLFEENQQETQAPVTDSVHLSSASTVATSFVPVKFFVVCTQTSPARATDGDHTTAISFIKLSG